MGLERDAGGGYTYRCERDHHPRIIRMKICTKPRAVVGSALSTFRSRVKRMTSTVPHIKYKIAYANWIRFVTDERKRQKIASEMELPRPDQPEQRDERRKKKRELRRGEGGESAWLPYVKLARRLSSLFARFREKGAERPRREKWKKPSEKLIFTGDCSPSTYVKETKLRYLSSYEGPRKEENFFDF